MIDLDRTARWWDWLWMVFGLGAIWSIAFLALGCFPGMSVSLGGQTAAQAGVQAQSGSSGGTVHVIIDPKTGAVVVDAGGGAAKQSEDAFAEASAAVKASAKKMDTLELFLLVGAGLAGIIYLLHTLGPVVLRFIKG